MDDVPTLDQYVKRLAKSEEDREHKRRKTEEESKAKAEAKAKANQAAEATQAVPVAAALPVAASSSSSSCAAATPVCRGTVGALPRIPEPPDLVTDPCFDVVKDGEVIERIALLRPGCEKSSWTFGRAADQVDFSVTHESCSRQHASATLQNGQTFLMDLGSAHGTNVDGRRLVKNTPVRLSSGANIRFGASTRVYLFRMPKFHSTAMIRHAALQAAVAQAGSGGKNAGGKPGQVSTRFRYRSTMGGATSDFA